MSEQAAASPAPLAASAEDSSIIKVVLLDIEGTVCPISFVKDVLFPYALQVLPKTLESQWENPAFAKYRDAFPEEHRSSKEALTAHVRDLMDQDVKIAYLKALQGYLWEEGYASGDLKAPLFPDVAAKLGGWHEKGLTVMIYSSGSVPAQKLLFKHTNAVPSDLTHLISDWFDTVNAGLKTEPESYRAIAESHPQFSPEHFLFLSDNVKEVDAAIAAGMHSVVVQRPGNAELPSDVLERLTVIETFDSLADDFGVTSNQVAGQKRDRGSEPEHDALGDDDQAPDLKKPRQTEEDAEDETVEKPVPEPVDH